MVRQTSRGKSAAARPTAGPPRPLTSRGMSAWPYHVTTSIPFIQYAHIRCWIKNNCANCALKREIQWFDDELFTHTCMTSPVKRADVTLSSEARGSKARSIVEYPKDCTWPIKSQNTNMDLWWRKSHQNHPYIVDWRPAFTVTPQCLDFSGPRVLLHCSNERLEHYAARGKPLWRHSGLCDVINAQSNQNKRAHPELSMH